MSTNRILPLAVSVLLLMMPACGAKQTGAQPDQTNASHQHDMERTESAEALPPKPVNVTLINSAGKMTGSAVLTATAPGTKLNVEVSGLKPGLHGIHFHEFGKCEKPDFKTAGEHWNPEGKHHGLENPLGSHAGDLPNLLVGGDGRAKAEFVTNRVTLDRTSLLKEGGTTLVIHEKQDDQKSDPSGNSGARVACGVIRLQ